MWRNRRLRIHSHRNRFADAEFDELGSALREQGLPVALEPRPLRLRAELLNRPGEVVTKDQLFHGVWNGRSVGDHVLANVVSKLLKALGPEAGARVVTVPRVGYRLEGPVQQVLVPQAPQVFTAGSPVPARESYLLQRCLGASNQSEVWLARQAKLGPAHVYKFGYSAVRLAALKHEFTISRHLQQALGDRDDFVKMLDTKFTSPPFFVECSYGGRNLLQWAEDGGGLKQRSLQVRLDVLMHAAGSLAAAHRLGVLQTQDIEKLTQAARARDWALRLRAERAHAQIALGDRPSDHRALVDVLPLMQKAASSPWLVASYQATQKEAADGIL